ncbi:MAG: magnesium transporter CorA family protein [Candidatus Aenigmarchaeota archaeon]|nr:magnesium transporter CorA family protein [Candidatus Aenigmarchaeota archaeon]
MIEFYIKTVKDDSLKKIESFRDGCWINVEEPTQEEIEKISRDFNIDVTWINDILDIDSKSRIEKHRDNVFLLIRIPYKDEENEITTLPMGIIMTGNYIMTISFLKNQIIEDIKNAKFKVNTTQRLRFVLKIFERTNRNFDKYLEYLRKRAEVIEEQVSLSLTNNEIYQLLQIQKTLIYFSSALVANEIVFEKINSGKIFKMYEEDKDLIEDIVLSNREIYESIKIMRDVLSNTLDAYASIVSNNLNIVMKFLTSMSIILSFPILLASLYGMNVQLPLQENPNAFWFIILLIIIIFWLLYIFFKRKNWL